MLVAAVAVPSVAHAAKAGSDADLWATVNACNPADAAGTVGIRGSMPGNGIATDKMFMRIQLQFQGPRGAWRMIPGTTGDSGWLPMGSAKQKRHQGGQTFSIQPTPNQPVTLRALVNYEWRAPDGTVARHAKRITTAPHVSAAGADPAGFSAATCVF
jgi:hypothetical protein